MPEKKDTKMKRATKEPIATWNIQNFPVKLRQGFMAAASLQGKTGKQLLEEQITKYLKGFFKGETPSFEKN